MTSFNTIFGAAKALFQPPTASKAPATDEIPLKMKNDVLVKGGVKPAAQNPQLANAGVTLDRAIDRRRDTRDALAAELAQPNVSQKRLAQGQLELAVLDRELKGLDKLSTLVDRASRNPFISGEDASRLSSLAAEAGMGTVSSRRQGQIAVEAEDIVRNAGRKQPSDRGLYHATRQLTEQRGDLEDQLKSLAAEATSGNVSQSRLAQIQLTIADGESQLARLDAVKTQADRLASVPGASGQAVDQMKHLMSELNTGNVTERRATSIQVEAEDLGRNAKRTTPSDRGVYHAVVQLSARVGDIADQQHQLVREASSGNVGAKRMVQIQLQLDDLQNHRNELGALKAEADRIVDAKVPASPEALDRLKALMAEASGNVDAKRLHQIIFEASQIGR